MAPGRKGRAACASLLAFGVLTSACASQRQSELMKEQSSLKASSTELRFEVVELARGVSSEVEAGANAVRDSTDDPAVRRDALLWKVNAIPRIQAAALEVDPLM